MLVKLKKKKHENEAIGQTKKSVRSITNKLIVYCGIRKHEVLLDKICFIALETSRKIFKSYLFAACFWFSVLAIPLPVSKFYTNAIQNTDLEVFN